MDEFIEGSVVSAVIEMPVKGSAITSATYRVFNESHTDLVVPTAYVPLAEDEVATIGVSALVNGLDGKARGFRSVELTLNLATGEKKILVYSYTVKGSELWALPAVSFQTYEEAMLVSMELTNLPAWNMADEPTRKAALKEAHHRIDALAFDMVEATEFPDFNGLEPGFQGRLSNLDEAEFLGLPEAFLSAIYNAQVLEADNVIISTDATQRRAEGVMSMTVGESSATFRAGKPVRTPLCKRAYDYLTRYVAAGNRLYRG